jgi:hypothetical protein
VELKLFCHLSSSTTFTVNTRFPSLSEQTVLKMVEDRWAMYDRFSDKSAHFAEWFELAKNILKLPFVGDHCEAKCRAIGARTEGCCLSVRCLVTLLIIDLCRTTWCDTNMERCRQPHPLSQMEAMMRIEWMT